MNVLRVSVVVQTVANVCTLALVAFAVHNYISNGLLVRIFYGDGRAIVASTPTSTPAPTATPAPKRSHRG